jgi:hypothetical protein
MSASDHGANSGGESPPRPRRTRRRAPWIVGTLVLAVVLLAGLFGTFSAVLSPAPPPPSPSAPPVRAAPGCLSYNRTYDVDVGEMTEVSARVDFGQCVEQLQEARDYELVSDAQELIDQSCATMTQEECDAYYQQVLAWYNGERDEIYRDTAKAIVGGRAHVELSAPLFQGQIQPVSNVDQMVAKAGDVGRWTWHVRVDKPGDHKAGLVMTILDPETNEVVFQNRPEQIAIRAPMTSAYVIGAAWSGISNFGTSVAGLVVAIVGALAAVIGIAPKLRRRKKSAKLAPGSAAGGSDGYL